jgi:ribokinase
MIIVFGSINLDIVTRAERIPGPGETVKGESYQLIPGGKGANQALAARRAGSETVMVGAVGKDSFADLALENLWRDGVDLSLIRKADIPTGIANITVDENGENAITVASGANNKVTASQLDVVERPTGYLLTQNEVPASENILALAKARELKLKTIYNAAPAKKLSDEELGLIDWLVVNETEALIVAQGAGVSAGLDSVTAAEALSEKTGNNIIVTLGSKGAYSFGPAGNHHGKALNIDVRDTTAAGDTFTGVFAASLEQGFEVADALRRASTAGSLACTAFGAQPSIPDKAAIEKAL